MMRPEIRACKEKIFIGMNREMSLAENKTFELFSMFMPRRKEISDSINTSVYDLRIYKEDYFIHFKPTSKFVKWALLEVSNIDSIPSKMESFKLESGSYAVFAQNGAEKDPNIFQRIFMEWLPNSSYELDDRPHFEILSTSNIKNDPNGKQEIWIPIR